MIQNLGKYAHPAKKQSRMPITGGKTEMRPKAPSTSVNNSLQAQANIQRPPAPFKNPAGIANVPAPTGPKGVNPGSVTRQQNAGLSGSKAPSNPPVGPVGNYRPKTLGKMVGVNFPGKKVKYAMNASAKKGGHSLLYGD